MYHYVLLMRELKKFFKSDYNVLLFRILCDIAASTINGSGEKKKGNNIIRRRKKRWKRKNVS